LIEILKKRIQDKDILLLLRNIIGSFNSGTSGIGLPLGNLTSQLLVNIYMNEFDQYVKHVLKVKQYIRYADDFVFLSNDKNELKEVRQKSEAFLTQILKLTLHPNKVFLNTFASGVDFLGWVHFPHHKVLRTVTKKRMMRRVSEGNLSSYIGLLSHGNGHKISEKIL
jgi:retron-type reverse transcriptase